MSSEIETQEKIRTTKGKRTLCLILSFSMGVPVAYVIKNFTLLSLNGDFLPTVLKSLILSIIGFFITYQMIPTFMLMNLKKNLKGVDINKVEDRFNKNDPNRKEVPESLGIVPATVFLIVSIVSQIFFKLDTIQHLEYTASLSSVCFMIFLGFSDDVLDLRWRYKLVLPLIASFPLLFAYSGATTILIPKLFVKFIGINAIELGIIYKIYMSMLAIFCTNSINIYAGINGLEVGQSLIIALSIIFFNFIEVANGKVEENLFSITIMLPFFMCSLALFMYNKFPSQCFIGDTFCYFAGMSFACAGILGHFTKTILLFFIPQILNFLLSLPQLIGLVPIERHRLPKFSAKTKKLTGQAKHWNLLNVALRILGPQREQDICNYLLVFQILCSVFAFVLRFTILSV